MKTYLLIPALIAAAIPCMAQDYIYKRDGSKEEVKVLEITGETVRYKKASNPSGPDYVVGKDDLLLNL